jgi:hypothetical protein
MNGIIVLTLIIDSMWLVWVLTHSSASVGPFEEQKGFE